MFGISKFFPVKRDLKTDPTKFALEKICSADADVAGIAKYLITNSARSKMLAGLAACVIKEKKQYHMQI